MIKRDGVDYICLRINEQEMIPHFKFVDKIPFTF